MTYTEITLACQLCALVAMVILFIVNHRRVREMRRIRADIDKHVEDADKHFDERRAQWIEERQAMEESMAEHVAAIINERTGSDVSMEIEEVHPVSRTRGKPN